MILNADEPAGGGPIGWSLAIAVGDCKPIGNLRLLWFGLAFYSFNLCHGEKDAET